MQKIIIYLSLILLVDAIIYPSPKPFDLSKLMKEYFRTRKLLKDKGMRQ